MHAYLSALLDLLYPPRCPACGRLSGELLCRACLPELESISGPICGRCGRPRSVSSNHCPDCAPERPHFSWARSAWIFSGPGREIIYDFKYRNNTHLAEALAETLLPFAGSSDVVSWVPLARSKKWVRGYNQAELLGRRLARLTGLPAAAFLKRVRRTADQSRLSPEERRKNVHQAFTLRPGASAGGLSILLVDDVLTTGSTASECARVLIEAGAKAVHVATLARAL